MNQEEIKAINHHYCRFADKWHQMYLGFTSSFVDDKDGIIFIKTRVGTQCKLTSEEVSLKVAECFSQMHELIGASGYHLEVVKIENITGLVFDVNDLNRNDTIKTSLDKLTAPVVERKETIQIFKGTYPIP